jgi:putative salt-induced outer membrane protein YdiY/RNase P/RNase MRP subunit p29
MLRKTHSIFAVVLCLFLSGVVLADQITLKNGDRLTGKIVKSDDKELVIQTESAGAITVKRDAIATINSEQPLNVFTSDGQKLVGPVETQAEKVVVNTKDAGVVDAPLAKVNIIRSNEEQARVEAEEERYRNPGLTDLWVGAAEVGLSLARGNSDTFTFVAGGDAVRATRRDKTTIYASLIRASNSVNGARQTSASAVRFGGRYDINFSKKMFGFGFADVEYNRFQLVEPRLVLGGGIGRNIIKNDRTVFDIFAGASSNQEFFTNGTRRRTAEVLFGEELTRRLNSRSLLKHRFVIYPNVSDTGEFRSVFDLSLLTNLSSRLSWHVTIGDRYVSNPLPGAKSNDLLFTTGIRTTFGRKQ